MKTHQFHPKSQPIARRERGVVLLFALIALLIMMIGAVALVRSFNTSLINTGSIAFKKDLLNRNEVAVAQVINMARSTGNLSSGDNAIAIFPTMNYAPGILSDNPQGIPLALLMNNADFNGTGFSSTGNDIARDGGVSLRYVIDRQCSGPGMPTASTCISAGGIQDGGSSDVPIRAENSARGKAGGLSIIPVYRVSIRATGPKGTMAFYQSTFTLN